MEDQLRILIVRPDRLGDVVLSTSIPREIKKQYPGSFVAVMLRKYTKEIYANNPFVDEIILLDDMPVSGIKNFFSKVKEIRSYRFTHSMSLFPTERVNYLLFFAGIPNRIGSSHKFYQFITNTKSTYRRDYNPLRHEADYCFNAARKIGIESNNFIPELYLTEEERIKANLRRETLLDGKKYLIGIHTASGGSAPNWSAAMYGELAKVLSEDPEIKVVITDQKEIEISGIAGIEFPHLNLSMRESIIEFAAMDLLVSNSTGPMHVCAALQIKTVALFCPLTPCSPKLWGPLGNESVILMPRYSYCQNQCPGPSKCNFEGNLGIKVSDAIEKINLLLSR